MKTTKPISTISFNTLEYCELICNDLLDARKIQFWAFIKHKPEDDEGGTKEHIHVYMEPTKLIQTEDFKDAFKELVPGMKKPLGVISFNSSKFADWYLYGLHDKAYLASKGQSRKYHYLPSEFHCSDEDEMTFRIKQIDTSSFSAYNVMKDYIDKGFSFADYATITSVPIQQIKAFQTAWYLIVENRTHRNGKEGHSDEHWVDEETGEIK